MDLHEADDSLIQEFRARRERYFRSAELPLYGLPPTHTGARSLGGWQGVDDRIVSLSLIHGKPWTAYVEVFTDDLEGLGHDPSEGPPTLETYKSWKGTAVDLLCTRNQVFPFPPWEQKRQATEEEKLEALTRALGPATEMNRTIEVDGEPVAFVGLAAGEAWGMRAVHHGYGLTICGSGDAGDELALVRIRDVEPYISGSPH